MLWSLILQIKHGCDRATAASLWEQSMGYRGMLKAGSRQHPPARGKGVDRNGRELGKRNVIIYGCSEWGIKSKSGLGEEGRKRKNTPPGEKRVSWQVRWSQ